jgi:hypothetical protein
MIGVGVLAQHHRGLMSMGLELLDSGFEFSDSWWLVQNLVSKEYWDNYHRHIAMCLVRYRSVDEVVDGLTSINLLTILADGCQVCSVVVSVERFF